MKSNETWVWSLCDGTGIGSDMCSDDGLPGGSPGGSADGMIGWGAVWRGDAGTISAVKSHGKFEGTRTKSSSGLDEPPSGVSATIIMILFLYLMVLVKYCYIYL